jgi:pSer/pThr/pTyr-binding forkhead associated (FHA) protein
VETPDPFERYEIFIGRSEDCHVLIDDPLISRHHLVLKNDNGHWFCEKITQLGSVSVNGNSSQKMDLSEGDEIKCGAYSILVSELPQQGSSSAVQNYLNSVSGEANYAEQKQKKSPPLPAPKHEELNPGSDQELQEDNGLSLSEIDESSDIANDTGLGEEELIEENSELSDLDSSQSLEPIQEESLLPSDSFGENNLENFESENDSSNEDSNEHTQFLKAFVNYQLILFGDHAPYDRYQIDMPEIFIGRDPKKCQIILDDPEVSTVHAVLRKNNIDITLEDLNSSNGTILNGERINKSSLSTGDEFVIGSTSFTLETRSDLLEAESDRLMPVESGQSIETEEIQEEIVSGDEGDVNFNSEAPPEKSLFKRIWKDPVKRKKAIYVLAGITVIYLLLGPSEDENKPTVDASQAKTVAPKEDKNAKPKIQLSKELEQKRNMSYELGVSFFEQNKYFEALKEFKTVIEIDPEYKKVQTYFDQTKEGLKRLEELETQKRAEEERIQLKKLVEEMLVKAREAVKEKQVTVAENYFAQIAEKDPENIEVQQLKMELEAWQKEQERIALEKAAKEAARKAMVDALSPGKTYYLKKEWYKAILKLEEFLRRKGTDEDLVKEGSDMLSDSKTQLASELGPLIAKARSLKEGQDLKSAYEAYLEILKIEPTNAEALNEVDDIKNQLDLRSKRIYRDAIIAESLSLFNDAKEKFQEVQQISPSDSEYYRKATEKLKNYLE